MQVDIGELTKILGKQKRVIGELLEISADQQQAIKLGDVSRLSSFTGAQEYLSRQLTELEARRRIVVEKYSREVGGSIDNYRQLEGHTSADDYMIMMELREEIVELSQRLKNNQALNSLLLRQRLKITDRVLEALKARNSCTYKKTGDVQRNRSKILVDMNA